MIGQHLRGSSAEENVNSGSWLKQMCSEIHMVECSCISAIIHTTARGRALETKLYGVNKMKFGDICDLCDEGNFTYLSQSF